MAASRSGTDRFGVIAMPSSIVRSGLNEFITWAQARWRVTRSPGGGPRSTRELYNQNINRPQPARFAVYFTLWTWQAQCECSRLHEDGRGMKSRDILSHHLALPVWRELVRERGIFLEIRRHVSYTVSGLQLSMLVIAAPAEPRPWLPTSKPCFAA